MISVGISVISLGLSSPVAWGAGDFSGGLASKRVSVFSVVVLSQLASLVLMVLGAFLIPEGTNSLIDIVIGGLAGICGAAGLVALYSGLARSPMGLVASVTGVVAAVIPVLFGTFLEGVSEAGTIIGTIIALFSRVVDLSRSPKHDKSPDKSSITDNSWIGIWHILCTDRSGEW